MNINNKLWIFPLITVDYNAYVRSIGTREPVTADRYGMIRKHDLFSKFVGIVAQCDGEEPRFSCINEPEKTILEKFWEWEESSATNAIWGASRPSLAGWHINDMIWPKLVNRTLACGLQLNCKYALQPPNGKWSDASFYDLYNVYKFGSFDRPEIPLHLALEMWTGESYSSEELLGMAAIGSVSGIDVPGWISRYVKAMQNVSVRYGR